MKSDLPKVLHPVGGRPMICAVVDACRQAGCERIVLVVGHKQELVRAVFKGQTDVEFVVQEPQLGTGHAVRCAEALFKNEASKPGHDVFVLAGDGPLIRVQTLRSLLKRHRYTRVRVPATLATSVIPDPAGYGRITRNHNGEFLAIVEDKDCTPAQRDIREVNPSYYCFDAQSLFEALSHLRPNKATGEFYITNVFLWFLINGRRVEIIDAVPPEDVLSINTPEQLVEVDRIFRSRRDGAAQLAGKR